MDNEKNECGQANCKLEAAHSYCWPGRPDRIYACSYCIDKAKNVAAAMGFSLSDLRDEEEPKRGKENRR